MQTVELKPGVFCLKTEDPALRVFDIIMQTKHGTSYNAYLVKGSEATALIDASKAPFTGDFCEALSAIVDPATIDYLIVSHTEPDHSGAIEELLQQNEKLTVYATKGAISFLRQIVNRDFDAHPITDGETLSLGDKSLTFFPMPNLHWPDTMFTYLPEDRILFTCDAFGAHYCAREILYSKLTDEEKSEYLAASRYYFDMILAPFKRPFLTNALARIAPLAFDMIAVGHGPVIDEGIDELIARYQAWCAAPQKERPRIVMAYVSAYGFTRTLAKEIQKGIEEVGGVDLKVFDLVDSSSADALAEMVDADGILLGTPTILGDALEPILSLTNAMFAPVYGGKHAAVFGSYGWSGEGVPFLAARLRHLRLKVTDEFRVRFKPSEEEMQKARDLGSAFARTVLGQ